MPKALIDYMGYSFFFWSNENDKPVHIRVSKGSPSDNSSKFWITSEGVKMEHNKASIKNNDLKKIIKYINLNKEAILYQWFLHFKK